ncbi:TadE/TadG family type IV pilus assembly protein [Desulfovibrio aminophilus]|uniref:TadE/TadG family type IV pilus assembly protein n=1 Tax=Desulfovibrio aminophilus TaxID=81425 RepID=UPI003398AD54
MRKRHARRRGQRGMAAVEFALILPVLAALFFLILEGANAIRTYSIISEASREAARLVLREGSTTNVEFLVQSLTAAQLPAANLNTNVTVNSEQKTVTVEVDYDYQSMLGSQAMVETFNSGQPYVLLARTTMPLP